MIECQFSCGSYNFPVLLNFCPILLFTFQFLLFYTIALHHLQDAMKIFTQVGVKQQGKNEHICVLVGGRIGTLGQNIYPVV